MRRLLLALVCGATLSCTAKSNIDIEMDTIEYYLSDVTIRDKDQYNRIRAVIKLLNKLNFTDATVVYRYLQLKVKNSCLFIGE